MTAPGPAAPPPYPPPPSGPGGPEQLGVPAPPPGPGAAPPFAVPPTEGRNKRMWVGLGVGALAVLLCCGGGGAAVVGLAITGSQAVNEQARAVTGDYYQAISDQRYSRAYDLLCDAAQRRESRPEFERRLSTEPHVTSYQVGDPRTEAGNRLVVPVNVRLEGGGQDSQQVNLAQDRKTGKFEVCGVS